MSWPQLVEQVGLHICSRRQCLHHSQECLALNIFADKTYLRRLERGQVNISLRLLFRVSSGLETSVYEFIQNIELVFSSL